MVSEDSMTWDEVRRATRLDSRVARYTKGATKTKKASDKRANPLAVRVCQAHGVSVSAGPDVWW